MAILTILLVSLIGSTHCAAMCGGFVTIASQNSQNPIRGQGGYHIGRLLIYLILGGIAGFIGGSINSIGSLIGLSQLAAVLLGLFFIYVGVSALFFDNKSLLEKLSPHATDGTVSWHQKLSLKIQSVLPFGQPFSIGLLSALLPCGWLYSFVSTAGATGSIQGGLATMFIFWIGTVPILMSLGTISRLVLQRWGVEHGKLTASLLLVAGVLSLLGHLGNPLSQTDTAKSCHHGHQKAPSQSVHESHPQE